MGLVKEETIKEYIEENGEKFVFCTEVKQYYYDSEEDKMYHKLEMEALGWNDSGQVKAMISGSLMPGSKNPPVYTWFGSYYKYTRSKIQNQLNKKKYFVICQSIHEETIASVDVFDTEEEAMKFLKEDVTSTYLEEIENSGNSEEDIDFELDDYSARLSSCNDEYVWTWEIIEKNDLRNS